MDHNKFFHAEQKRLAQAGFTIVELMVATLIFSVILLVITQGVLHFTTDYYRGVNSSSTQNIASAVTNTIAQSIQFSGKVAPRQFTSPPADLSGPGYFCVGGQEFMFYLGQQLTNQGDKGIYEFSPNSADCEDLPTATADPNYAAGHELLQQHMRVVRFDIDDSLATLKGLYTIAVTVVYGDADLLCDGAVTGGVAGDCTLGSPELSDATLTGLLAAGDSDIRCRSQSGSQFCAVSALTTTVQARVPQ